jgi:outer membrane protein
VRNIVLPAIIALILCAFVSTPAQAQRIGFVNSAKIFQELPDAKEAQKKIDAITKPYQDTLEARQKDLQSRYEEYQKKEGMMNDASKKAAQQELLDLERGFNEYRLEKFGADGDVAKQTEKAIERVSKEDKYSFVFDQTEQVKVLLYGDPAHDLTYKVIDKLKRGK